MFFEFKTIDDKPIGINDDHIVYVYPGDQVDEGQVGVHVPNTIIVLSTRTHDGLMMKNVRVLGSYEQVMDMLVVV
jgi:hypothetical protein